MDQEISVPIDVVDERYFSTLGIPLLAGRTFDAGDSKGRPEVVIVNRTLARRFWPNGDAIGQRLHIRNGHRVVQVIGEVGDGRYGDLDEEPLPFIYFALEQHYLGDVTIAARTARDARAFTRVFGDALQRLDATMPGPSFVRTFADDLHVAMIVPTLMVVVTGGLGALALLLTLVGVYGTVFHSVSQRRTEIGIRVALGAQPRDLLWMVLRHGAALATVGCATGIGLSQLSLPIVSAAFYGIRPVELGLLCSVVFLNVLMGLAIAYLVARPWMRLSAMDIVRQP